MRKYLLVFLILSICFNSISQGETEPYEHKKWMVKSILSSQPYVYKTNRVLPNFFTGIGVKRYFGNVGARFSFERIVNKDSDEICLPYYTIHKVEGFEENVFRFGTEYKNVYYDFMSLHFFVDYIFASFEGETLIGRDDGSSQLYEKHKGFTNGGIIGMGFDYLFSEHFSVGLETRIEILNNSGSIHRNNFIENYTVTYNNSTNEFNLKLLGNLSINYNF